jgi:small-conductance mechanosensitive channel
MPRLRPEARPFRPGAARALTLQALHASRRARRELVFALPLLIGVVVVNAHRQEWFPKAIQLEIRAGAAVVLMGLGWLVARDMGRSLTPWLHRRMDAATAGTVGFLIRLGLLVIIVIAVAKTAGLNSGTLAVGGAVFAVVFGLAAQQTLGNVIAGLVLISAQPFRVGDRVRLQAGGLAGVMEGVVASHGLLYTTFAQGEDTIMVPNNVVLTAAVVPLREPAEVDLRARLRPDVKPTDVQAVMDRSVRTPIRGEPRIALEEADANEVVVRITARPESDADGPRLADEVLAAVSALTQEGRTEERRIARSDGGRWNARDEDEHRLPGDRPDDDDIRRDGANAPGPN